MECNFLSNQYFSVRGWELQICICTNVEKHKGYKISLKKATEKAKGQVQGHYSLTFGEGNTTLL